MKLVSLFYSKIKTWLILGTSSVFSGAVFIPSAIAGEKYEEFLFREFNPSPEKFIFSSTDKVSDESPGNHKTFSSFRTVNVPNSSLIKGTTRYNNGNYVLYFGSEACPNCNNFLYNAQESPKSSDPSLDNIYRNGIWFETYSLFKHITDIKKLNGLNDLKFIFFSDEFPSMEYRNNDDLRRIPWTTWENTVLSQGKIKGDYLRNDKSAVDFRKLFSILQYYYGEKANGIPIVIIYKGGVPFVYSKDKIEELEAESPSKLASESLSELSEESVEKNIFLRFDLLRHLKYIFNSELTWIRN